MASLKFPNTIMFGIARLINHVSSIVFPPGDNYKQQQPNDNRHGPRNGQRNKHKQWRWHKHGDLNQYEHEHQREEFQPRTAIRKSALRDSSSERESEKESKKSASTGGTEVRVNPVRYSCFIFDFAQNIVACSAINLFSKICISSKNQLKGGHYLMGGTFMIVMTFILFYIFESHAFKK